MQGIDTEKYSAALTLMLGHHVDITFGNVYIKRHVVHCCAHKFLSHLDDPVEVIFDLDINAPSVSARLYVQKYEGTVVVGTYTDTDKLISAVSCLVHGITE